MRTTQHSSLFFLVSRGRGREIEREIENDLPRQEYQPVLPILPQLFSHNIRPTNEHEERYNERSKPDENQAPPSQPLITVEKHGLLLSSFISLPIFDHTMGLLINRKMRGRIKNDARSGTRSNTRQGHKSRLLTLSFFGSRLAFFSRTNIELRTPKVNLHSAERSHAHFDDKPDIA